MSRFFRWLGGEAPEAPAPASEELQHLRAKVQSMEAIVSQSQELLATLRDSLEAGSAALRYFSGELNTHMRRAEHYRREVLRIRKLALSDAYHNTAQGRRLLVEALDSALLRDRYASQRPDQPQAPPPSTEEPQA